MKNNKKNKENLNSTKRKSWKRWKIRKHGSSWEEHEIGIGKQQKEKQQQQII